MSLLNILQFPDPRLKQQAALVEHIDDQVKQLAEDMLETMYATGGIGLATIQINRPDVKMCTIDTSHNKSSPTVMINPEITQRDGKVVSEEGCLSLPGVSAKITRAENVTVTYLDLNGEQQELEATGLLARCIQHECDHLNGTLFYDHLSPLKQQMLRKKLKKIRDRSL